MSATSIFLNWCQSSNMPRLGVFKSYITYGILTIFFTHDFEMANEKRPKGNILERPFKNVGLQYWNGRLSNIMFNIGTDL